MLNKPLNTVSSPDALRDHIKAWRAEGLRIGFVPTMGALHAGHLSLIKLALEQADRVVVSIFVNPTQFAPGEDFDEYPRDEASDCAKLQEIGAHLAYIPGVLDMYPEGSLTNVSVEGLSDLLDGGPRPHFFYGVTTVVARLFLHVQPDIAIFGEKDYQQLQIIRRMVRDLGFPIEIIGGPTVRDGDGLAQSSRNTYLSQEERRAAGALQAALHRARCRIRAGAALPDVLNEAESHLLKAGFSKVDYVSAIDPATLSPLSPNATKPTGRLLGAAWMGETRLIDNMAL